VTNYFIEQATLEDLDDLLAMIATSFVKLDPFTNHLGVGIEEFSAYIEPYIDTSIRQQYAYIARNSDGICIAGSTYHDALSDVTWDLDKLPYKIQASMSYFKSQYHVVPDYLLRHQLKLAPGLILCAGFLATHPNYFGAGISDKIDRILWPLAQKNGFKFILAEFTNLCSFHLYKKNLGNALEVLSAAAYKDFLDENHSRPFEEINGECILAMVNLSQIL